MKNIKFVDNMVNENKGNLLFSVDEFKANREVTFQIWKKLIEILLSVAGDVVSLTRRYTF